MAVHFQVSTKSGILLFPNGSKFSYSSSRINRSLYNVSKLIQKLLKKTNKQTQNVMCLSSSMSIKPAESLMPARGHPEQRRLRAAFTSAAWQLAPVIALQRLDRLLRKYWPFNCWQGQLVPVSSHTSARYHSCRPQWPPCTLYNPPPLTTPRATPTEEGLIFKEHHQSQTLFSKYLIYCSDSQEVTGKSNTSD